MFRAISEPAHRFALGDVPFKEDVNHRCVVLEWEAYPAAATYQVQLTEAQDPRNYSTRRQVFECCSRPSVSGTSFNLSERGVKLKKGYSYFFDISAVDVRGRILADSSGKQLKPDFMVTD